MMILIQLGFGVLEKLVLDPIDKFLLTPIEELGLSRYSEYSLDKVKDRYAYRKSVAQANFESKKKERLEYEKLKKKHNS